MASLLNNASLLLNPAGSIISYQEDKIYSVLPKDGTGDFTFSGGDGGTRVNQQGYIEQTPANLITYSEDFSNWTGNLFSNWINCAVTTNFAEAPNGTLTADRLGDGYSRFNASATAIPGQTYTFSIYLKNISLNASFDVYAAWGLNGSLVSYNPPIGSVAISDLSTTEWKRFTFTTTAPSSGINQMQFGIAPFTGYGTNPAGTFILAWGGMVNIGSTALPYQPTTDRLNYPRITYQNGRGALLQEPQRTNLLTYSNGFDLWSYAGITVTTGSAISPDGTQNAFLLTTTNATNHQLYKSQTASGALAFSVWAKKGNSRTFYLAAYNNNFAAYWDLDTGAVISTAGSGVSALPGVQYKDGWMLYTMLFTNVNNEVQIGFLDTYYTGNNPGPWGVSTSVGTTGYIYGAQLEAGEFASTYIPTTSATVTRPADASNDTSATSVIGQTAGTLYTNFTWLGPVSNVDSPILSLGDQSYGNSSIVISTYNSGLYGRVTNGISADANINFGTMTPGVQYKCALAYANNDVQFFVNGISYGQDTGVSIPALGSVYLQNSFPNSKRIGTSALYTSRLTNTQLAELTTVRSGSGGNISYYGPYTIHTFTGSATFTPSFTGPVEVLVVAGGGGGGQNHGGGGGGAGGLLYASSYGVAAGSGITVTVGSGGAIAGNGSNTIFGGLTAIGGGLGASEGANNGGNGGSGGGGTGFSSATNGGSGTPGQGFDGGKGGFPDTSGIYGSGGGGGGASAPGTDGKEGQDVSGSAGNGGNGLPYSINGFSTYYAGGGGGGYWGSNLAYYGVGGLGGGGNGGAGISTTLLPTPGVNGLGGGGGGSRGDSSLPRPGSTGGSGIVIVRYLT